MGLSALSTWANLPVLSSGVYTVARLAPPALNGMWRALIADAAPIDWRSMPDSLRVFGRCAECPDDSDASWSGMGLASLMHLDVCLSLTPEGICTWVWYVACVASSGGLMCCWKHRLSISHGKDESAIFCAVLVGSGQLGLQSNCGTVSFVRQMLCWCGPMTHVWARLLCRSAILLAACLVVSFASPQPILAIVRGLTCVQLQ